MQLAKIDIQPPCFKPPTPALAHPRSSPSQEHSLEQQQRLDEFELATKQMADELEKREIEVKVTFPSSSTVLVLFVYYVA